MKIKLINVTFIIQLKYYFTGYVKKNRSNITDKKLKILKLKFTL